DVAVARVLQAEERRRAAAVTVDVGREPAEEVARHRVLVLPAEVERQRLVDVLVVRAPGPPQPVAADELAAHALGPLGRRGRGLAAGARFLWAHRAERRDSDRRHAGEERPRAHQRRMPATDAKACETGGPHAGTTFCVGRRPARAATAPATVAP